MRRNTPDPRQDRRGAPAARQNRLAASFSGSTYDATSRTVQAVLATGVRVERWWWSEELSMDPAAIDLGRVAINQCRFLFNHDSDQPIGVVQRAALENGALVATIRFAETPQGDQYAGMVQRGELTGVSIGYQVRNWQLVEILTGDQEVWRATSWELLEASLVSVPADPNAGVRSAAPLPGAPIPSNQEDDMRRNHPGAPPAAPAQPTAPAAPEVRAADPALAVQPAPATPAAPADPNPVRATPALTVAETLQLHDQARALGVETQARAAFDAPGATGETIRAAILAHAAARQAAAAQPAGPSGIAVVRDETETRRAGMRSAVLWQLRGRTGDLAAEAEPFRRHSLVEMAAVRMGDRDMPRTAAERIEVMERAMHSTSDFPNILGGALNARLDEQYQIATPSYRRIARQMTFNDFRAHDVIRAGDFPQLQAVGQNGEIKFGTLGDKKESVTVGAYAVQFGLSRQLLINDNLGAIDQVLGQYGLQVALFEELTFQAMKGTVGPTLVEGNAAMFTTGRGNLASSGSAISTASLATGRAALRKMKNLAKNQMGLAPSILYVSPDKETEAEMAVANITPVDAAKVNPFSGKLEVVVAPTASGNAWELYVAPALGANWTYGLLDGYTAPRLKMEDVFGQQGTKVSLEHDFGCGGIDFRFGYRDPGA